MNFLSGLENLQNVHPLFVHFPIALTLITFLFEGLWWVTKKKPFRDTATHLLYLSAVFAVATVITGYLAADGLGMTRLVMNSCMNTVMSWCGWPVCSS